MDKIILSKKQSKDIARDIYADVKQYCDDNFERFIIAYREECKNANGSPIESMAIKFNLCSNRVDYINDSDLPKG